MSDLDAYMRQQLATCSQASEQVVAALTTMLEAEDPDPDTWAQLAATYTQTYATVAALSSAGYLSLFLAGEGIDLPVPEVSVGVDEDALTGAYRGVGRLAVDAESRQFFTIRDRLVKAEGLDKVDAERRAMQAIRDQAKRRADRLAANTVRDAGADSLSEAMELSGRIVGWTRVATNCCDVCADLADGTVLPPGARMVRHPRCDCTQKPILREDRA